MKVYTLRLSETRMSRTLHEIQFGAPDDYQAKQLAQDNARSAPADVHWHYATLQTDNGNVLMVHFQGQR